MVSSYNALRSKAFETVVSTNNEIEAKKHVYQSTKLNSKMEIGLCTSLYINYVSLDYT